MSERKPGRLRVALLAIGGVSLVFCLYETVWLYVDAAPFGQMYYEASADDDRRVTKHMIAALLGLPISLAVTLIGVYGPRVLLSPRRWLRWVGFLLLLNSMQGCGVCMSLPYGFGSSYEHATPEQHSHLDLSRRVGLGCLGLSLVAFVFSAGWAKPRGAADGDSFLS